MSGKRSASGVGGTTTERVHEFKWNQQGSRVLEQLRTLYGDQGEGLGVDTDVILWGSDGTCVEAHKMVLGLCSPYFQKMFVQISQSRSHKERNGGTVVVLKDVRGSVLKRLVQFIYTGEVALPSGEMEEFLEIGNEFQIEGITYSSSSSASKEQQKLQVTEKPKSGPGVLPEEPEILSTSKPQNEVVDHHAKEMNTPMTTTVTVDQNDVGISFDSYPVKMEPVNFVDESMEGDEEDPLAVEDDSKLDDEDSSQEEENTDCDDDVSKDPTFGKRRPQRKRARREQSSTSSSSNSRFSHFGEKRLYDWVVQNPLSEEEIDSSWGVRNRTISAGIPCVEYQCRLGIQGYRSCTAKIKMKTLNDGTVVWMNNGMPHTKHRPGPPGGMVRGMTPQQREFIMQCVEDKVDTTDQILLKFQIMGLEPPNKKQLREWLDALRANHPEKFAD